MINDPLKHKIKPDNETRTRALELSPRGVANIGGFRAFRLRFGGRIVPYQDDGRKEVSAPSPSGSGAKTGSKQLNAWEDGLG